MKKTFILKLEIEDPEDQHELDIIISAKDTYNVLHSIIEELRSIRKYNKFTADEPTTEEITNPAALAFATHFESFVYELINEKQIPPLYE